MLRYATTSSTTAAMRNPLPRTTVVILALGALIVRQLGEQCGHATRATHARIHQTNPHPTTEQQKPRGHYDPEQRAEKDERAGGNLHLPLQAQWCPLAACRGVPGILPCLYSSTEIVDGRITGVEQPQPRLCQAHTHNAVQNHLLPCLLWHARQVKGGQRQKLGIRNVLGGIL